MISPRYSITHPLLTPELFRATPAASTAKVRGLHIFQDRTISPEVILDTPLAIKDKIFPKLRTRCLHFPQGFHMYISAMQGFLVVGENILATYLMRLHYLNATGAYLPDTIYGDVAVFGSGTAYRPGYDNRDYSVPYEIVEEIVYLYEQI